MGFFDFLRPRKQPLRSNQAQSRIVDAFVPNFTVVNNRNDSDIYATALDACVTHCSKFRFVPKVKDKITGLEIDNPDRRFYEMFTLRPNLLQSHIEFMSQTAKYYFDMGVAVIYVNKTDDGYPINMWNIDPRTMQRYVLDNGEVWYRFNANGVVVEKALSDIIVLQRNVNYEGIFGYGRNPITKVLEIINTNDDGIIAAVQSSAFIRFIIQSSVTVNEKAKIEKAQKFSEEWLKSAGTAGVIWTDVTDKITQVSNNNKYESPADMETMYKRIYSYFRINSAVANNDYTEQQFQSAYESAFEPFAIKINEALNWNIFDQNERSRGNKFIIDNSNLTSMSNASKRAVAEIKAKMPIVIPNEINRILGLPETDYGNTPYYTFGSNGAVNNTTEEVITVDNE